MSSPNATSSSSTFTPLQNDSFLRACLRQATDHTPVWLMRQA
ncbi:MAG: uroporphyrinogen decarboxylase family protein, partial [Burkholderiales bacterium]